MAELSSGAEAARYRAVLTPDSPAAKAADDYFLQREPRYASMLRTSLTPTIVQGGYRFNVIPSEAKATVDTRMLPDEDPAQFLETVRKIVNDPAVSINYAPGFDRPIAKPAQLDSEAFRTIKSFASQDYDTVTLPTMGTAATDMAQVRSRTRSECYGIGGASDFEDGAKGYGAHSDQERILESELHRFVRFSWNVVVTLARAK
jgi:acetylornithine deacetylase/succinyl-diaminopimelate desuccinylase-like protein